MKSTRKGIQSGIRWVAAAIAALALALGLAPTATAAATVTWAVDVQQATDVAIGANGAVWAIGTTRVAGGYTIHRRLAPGSWETVPGGATRIAVGPDGQPWVVNSYNEIFHRVGAGWVLMPGRAQDIAVDGAGTAYIIGTNLVAGGYGIYYYVNDVELGGWWPMSGGAVRIGAGPAGVWVVNDANRAFRFTAGVGWLAVPGTATDVAVGGSEVWITGTAVVPGGHDVRRFNGVDWVTVGGGGIAVAADPGGNPWLVNNAGALFKGVLSGLGPRLCPVATISVPESAANVVAATLKAGESVRLTPNATSQIWAGVLFTGQNGPQGWASAAPAGFPLPGSPVYSLIVNKGLGWSYLGTNQITLTNQSGEPQTLSFRVNDNVPGNGTGAFSVGIAFTCTL